MFALGNGSSGVTISESTGNSIGGVVQGMGNTISGNKLDGITLTASGNNLIAGDLIGTNEAGGPLQGGGNGANGITIEESSSGNTIGGVIGAASNVISGNGVLNLNTPTSDNGVFVASGSADN